MNLLESYDKYRNQLKESFIKKTSSRNTDEVIKQADESFDTDFLFEKTFEEINSGKASNLDTFNFNSFRKPDPNRMTKLLRFALRNYPNKGICNFFAEKYSYLLQ